MSVLEENIKRINFKLQQLLKQHQLLQKENEQLKAAIASFKIRQENDSLLITQLEQQAGILKSAAGKMNETDKKIFEKHINQYIREIDKCIGLLSE
jgi:cell division septum initiation protein DivIVA